MALPGLVTRTFSILVCVVGLALALAASLMAAYETARATPRTGVLVAVVLAVFFGLSFLVTGLVIRMWKAYSRRITLMGSATLTALLAMILFLAVLPPLRYPHIEPVARANTRYWNLATGSRIAYSVYEPSAGVPVKAEPIVFVHGGPGVRAFDTDHAFYRQFAQDGFRVYLFDQAGSGLSDRLPHAADYSVERSIADIEEIRRQIGADRLILIGHSAGGTLVAHYAATHPDHVEKLIFHSPGPIAHWASGSFDYRRTDAKVEGPPPLKIMAAIVLSHASWSAAENLLPQQESGDWQVATSPAELGGAVCKGDSRKLPSLSADKLARMNLYPLLAINRELREKPEMDIHDALGRLHVPAIALESQCEFIPWSQHVEYKKLIPGLQEFYFPNAGHYINFSQPEKLAAVIRSFLLDQPPPFPAYAGDADPRPPVGKAGGE